MYICKCEFFFATNLCNETLELQTLRESSRRKKDYGHLLKAIRQNNALVSTI